MLATLLFAIGGAPEAPFRVFYNSAWPSCCGTGGLPKADPAPRFADFNITTNAGAAYQGTEVVTVSEDRLIATGLWPYFFFNKTSGSWVAVNGGIPQLVNISDRIKMFVYVMGNFIPDAQAHTVVFADWEEWYPSWEENLGNDAQGLPRGSRPMINASIDLVRKSHPTWSEQQLAAEAKRTWCGGRRSKKGMPRRASA